MALLLSGFVIFFGTHLSPGVFGMRSPLVNMLGEGRYRAFYIASSVVGMVCIIVGKAQAPYIGLYYPPLWATPLVPVLLALAFIMLAALFIPSNINRFTRHPMLWGIALWSTGHLLANGDLASVITFSGFGAYALISMWSLNRRGAQKLTTRYSPLRDLAVVILGLSLYAAVIWLHPYLFGVSAIPLIT
jgi:uncharacterized membrane protein